MSDGLESALSELSMNAANEIPAATSRETPNLTVPDTLEIKFVSGRGEARCLVMPFC